MKKKPIPDDVRATAQRRAYQECSKCGFARIAGQLFTPYTCRICHEKRTHPNTAVPAICPDCSKPKNLCCRCGGPMD